MVQTSLRGSLASPPKFQLHYSCLLPHALHSTTLPELRWAPEPYFPVLLLHYFYFAWAFSHIVASREVTLLFCWQHKHDSEILAYSMRSLLPSIPQITQITLVIWYDMVSTSFHQPVSSIHAAQCWWKAAELNLASSSYSLYILVFIIIISPSQLWFSTSASLSWYMLLLSLMESLRYLFSWARSVLSIPQENVSMCHCGRGRSNTPRSKRP